MTCRQSWGVVLAALALMAAPSARATILWSDLGQTLAHDSPAGTDILGGAVREDDSSSNTLYFKFHVDPLSDARTEEYFAGFELFEGDMPRLAVGNSRQAWAYSAFNTSQTGLSNKVTGDFDLHSSQGEPAGVGTYYLYELPQRGIERTIVFKVQYVLHEDASITVWLNPDLSPGATEQSQPESLTTTFRANAHFDQVRLVHGGGGGGWTFSDMAIATQFTDFVNPSSPETGRGLSSFTFRPWQREQGLPQNSVRALAQTSDGYLWLGSDDGLTRFDGVRFVTFGAREGLHGAPVSALHPDRDGGLWVGTVSGGLAHWDGTTFATPAADTNFPSQNVTALALDPDGRLFAGTDKGLAILNNRELVQSPAIKSLGNRRISALFCDRHNSLWMGVAGVGVFHYDGATIQPLGDIPDGLRGVLRDPHCLLVDHFGRLWIGAGDDSVLCRDGNRWLPTLIPRNLARSFVNSLIEEADGTVWAGSVSEGLFGFRQGQPLKVDAAHGLLDNSIQSLLVDREGNLWVGASAGLDRLRHSNLSVLSQDQGLGYGLVRGLAEVAPGIIWAAKPNDGVYCWSNGDFSRLAVPLLSREADLNSLLAAADGSVWLGMASGLLHFPNPATPSVADPAAPLDGQDVLSLLESPAKTIWAGTREGELWRWRNGKWTAMSGFQNGHPICALVSDGAAGVWIGTDGNGVFRFDGRSTVHINKAAGLLSDSIRSLYRDPDGTLWVGAAGGGLSRLRDGRVATLTTREGLPDNTISQFLEDDRGRFWLGTSWGIACLRRIDLENSIATKSAINAQVYRRAEGMVSEECAGGFSPGGLRTSAGLLWFPTLKGIVVADARAADAAIPSAPVLVEDVLVDGVKKTAEDLRIPPGLRRLEFRYTSPSFIAPERVRFRYRLEGLDADWVEAGGSRTALYSYVPPGRYRFQVACNSDGRWEEASTMISLTVLPHIWQEAWFLGLVVILLALSGGGAIRMAEKRKMQRRVAQLERERVLERERARIAQDLHDDLGSSLTRISLLSGLAREDKENAGQVEVHINKISQSAAQTLRALDEIVWALRPGSDSLQSLVEYIAHCANEMFEGDGVRCRLDLPADLPSRPLPPEMRHNIFLVVKEALANALKHSGAREVRVKAEAAEDRLEIIVQDNGKGFDLGTRGTGNGLDNMRRRAYAMGAMIHIESAPRAGATVRLLVQFAPLPAAPARIAD